MLGSRGRTMLAREAKSAGRVVVVVPALNEAETIGKTIEAIRGATREVEAELLIYVVDDGSTDDTGERARAAGADRILRHKVNRGLGAAVRTGLAAARDDGADVFLKFDADLQHDPADIPRMIAPIFEDHA